MTLREKAKAGKRGGTRDTICRIPQEEDVGPREEDRTVPAGG